ncbi:hypothetical protein ACMHYO_11665 [Allopusillimonas ginsengisoli]|uniref:hypothetical protein n=1 Tax=Allopusillimonas ginsengisoli TaxID=453575 RepID=UPI0039C01E45
MSTLSPVNATRAFQAYGRAGRVTRPTAKEAATAYFEAFPTSRKCDVVEGEANGGFFTVRYGRYSEGDWPKSYKNVTKSQASTLGDQE